MTALSELKADVLRLNAELTALLSRAAALPGLRDAHFEGWGRTCRDIQRQIAEEIFRVAVVGPIKSGKSTFTNALFKRDFLKRGAGVITSIVTRIRSGPEMRAILRFKSWDEINAEMDGALVLFPSMPGRGDGEHFDIRRSRDREALREALDLLGVEDQVSNGALNANRVLLSSYLRGYEQVREIVGAESVAAEFGGARFAEHKRFVSDDALSVFLKDIRLEIDAAGVDENIEIADCQGSDSPNPLHLTMIQDYLLHTHLVLYVISSRTGLRRADIRFLTMIRRMGIMDNILFILNVDFGEHESLADLEALARRVRDELALLRPAPEIYRLSALFNLLRAEAGAGRISPRDSLKLAQWQGETELAPFSDRESSRLEGDLLRKLTRERLRLMLGNHLERMAVVGEGLRRWMATGRELLTRDAAGAAALLDKSRRQQARIDQAKAVVRTTLDGAIQTLRGELRSEVDRFFHPASGALVRGCIAFVRDYQAPLERYAAEASGARFSHALYQLFVEFRGALERYMSESVNPEIIRFVRQRERQIGRRLGAVVETFDLLVRDSLERSPGCAGSGDGAAGAPLEIEAIRDQAGLSVPPAVASLRYSARVKTEAYFRLGVYAAVKLVRRLFKRPPRQGEPGQALRALGDGARQIQKETEEAIRFHFKSYQENLKFQYLFRVAAVAAARMQAGIFDRFQVYGADLSQMMEAVGESETRRREALAAMEALTAACQELEGRLAGARCRLADP
jgi:GTPase SAR1 family protein